MEASAPRACEKHSKPAHAAGRGDHNTGHAVAVVYPSQHQFPDRDTGHYGSRRQRCLFKRETVVCHIAWNKQIERGGAHHDKGEQYEPIEKWAASRL